MIARVVLAALVLLAASARADSSAEVPRRAHALAADLMSPYCPGRTLSDCPSPDAAAVREEIRARLHAGQSEVEVRAALENRFGEDLRGLPTALVGWLGPIAILFFGAAALAVALRRLSRRGAARVASTGSADVERALDLELRRRGL